MTVKKTPKRMCVGCREMLDKAELVRVVRSPEGAIALDSTFKAPGRGAYICRKPECLAKIRKARSLERAFKSPVPPEVYDMLEQALGGGQ